MKLWTKRFSVLLNLFGFILFIIHIIGGNSQIDGWMAFASYLVGDGILIISDNITE